MVFVGIDIAMDKHDIIIINDLGEVVYDHFIIQNNSSGFKKLHTVIKSCTKSFNDIRIGMEATGIYHNNLRDYLISKGYTVYCTNPMLVSLSRKSASPRMTKTDKIDSIAVCRHLMNNINSLHPYTPPLYHLDELKQLTRDYNNNKESLVKEKGKLKRLLQIIFPEFLKHFNPFSKWALELLWECPLPSDFKGLHIDSLANRIGTHANHFHQATVIKRIAKESIGNSNGLNSHLIKFCISNIIHFDSQNKELKKIISNIMKLFPKILSVPGIGPINGATILGETGDITRFPNKHKYTSLYGIEPIVHESGKYKRKRTKISKRGSKYLRTAIYSAARVACVASNAKDNKFRRKYLKMMSKGDKHHTTVIFAIAKNMAHTIYKILKDNSFYNDEL
ncbi:MAG: IS110 family transposase [Candidatus Izemoplasmatales bacterium]|nr:IS110 family transposase [Candidatus Izemoplasmatales bacterium]